MPFKQPILVFACIWSALFVFMEEGILMNVLRDAISQMKLSNFTNVD